MEEFYLPVNYYKKYMMMTNRQQLKNLRIENKLTQQKLADLIDVNREQIARWETGDRKLHNLKLLAIKTILNNHNNK